MSDTAMSIPQYCAYCGGRLTKLVYGKEGWTATKKCPNCQAVCRIAFGDQMGKGYTYVDWKKEVEHVQHT